MRKKRHPNPRLVKIHRTYIVQEIAELFNIHKNTVRNWIKNGLMVCDDKRPTLILGRDLITYLNDLRAKGKQPCSPGEIYCVRCRKPKQPALDMAEYTPITETFGNLSGICPDCETIINKRASFSKLHEIRPYLDVTMKEGEKRLIKM